MRTRKKLLLVAPEERYGAGADIASAIVVVVSALDSSPYEGDRVTRERLSETFGADAEANAAPYTTVTATVPVAGSGAAGTPANWGLLARACSMSETIAPGESVAYQPATENPESVCVWFVEDGQLQKVPGVRGTVEFTFENKQYPTMQYTLTGGYRRPEALTAPLNKQPENIVPEVVVNNANTGQVSVHGYQAVMQSLSFSMGNTVNYESLVGEEKADITARESTGSTQIKAPDITTVNYFQRLESHQAIQTGEIAFRHGTAEGNIVEFRAPRAQLSSISRTDSSGTVHYSMDTRLLRDQGDDEFTLTLR